MVDFQDPLTGARSTRDFSLDERSSVSVSSSCIHVVQQPRQRTQVRVLPDATANACARETSFAVTASVALGSFGILQSASQRVSVVRFVSLQLQLGAYPSGPSSGVRALSRVGCTNGAYQRAKPRVLASLSDGAQNP